MSTQQIIESWESGAEPYNATTKPIVKGKGMTDRLIYAWVNGVPAPADMQFPDERKEQFPTS
jgi:hypothetical protein